MELEIALAAQIHQGREGKEEAMHLLFVDLEVVLEVEGDGILVGGLEEVVLVVKRDRNVDKFFEIFFFGDLGKQ